MTVWMVLQNIQKWWIWEVFVSGSLSWKTRRWHAAAAVVSCHLRRARWQCWPDTSSSTLWQCRTSQEQVIHITNTTRVPCLLALRLSVRPYRLRSCPYVVLFSWRFRNICQEKLIQLQQRHICKGQFTQCSLSLANWIPMSINMSLVVRKQFVFWAMCCSYKLHYNDIRIFKFSLASVFNNMVVLFYCVLTCMTMSYSAEWTWRVQIIVQCLHASRCQKGKQKHQKRRMS